MSAAVQAVTDRETRGDTLLSFLTTSTIRFHFRLPGISPGSDDFGGDLLAQLEGKIAEKQESVQSKARELGELEARLAAAEARKRELESRGVTFP